MKSILIQDEAYDRYFISESAVLSRELIWFSTIKENSRIMFYWQSLGNLLLGGTGRRKFMSLSYSFAGQSMQTIACTYLPGPVKKVSRTRQRRKVEIVFAV